MKNKALSLFGTKCVLFGHGEREGHIGHLIDLTNPSRPLLYNLWGHWPGTHERFCLSFLSYAANRLDDFFAQYELLPEFEAALNALKLDRLSFKKLLRAGQSEIFNLVIMPEVRQDFLLDILLAIPTLSFMRFSRMIDRQGDIVYLFDTLYSFFHLEKEKMVSSIHSEPQVWEERSLSDTIVLSLNEERFFKEYIGERSIREIPILPGSKSRLRYVAIKRTDREDKPFYISRIVAIEGEPEGHGHRLLLAPEISKLNLETQNCVGLVPSYAKALKRKAG